MSLHYLSSTAIDAALDTHGLHVSNISRDEVTQLLNNYLFSEFAKHIDASRLVGSGNTVNLSKLQAASKVYNVLNNTKNKKQKGGNNSTTMSGSYFDPDNVVDDTQYTDAPAGTDVFPSSPGEDGVIRFPLQATGDFLPQQLSGGANNSWISVGTVQRMIKEYTSRGGNLRISNDAKVAMKDFLASRVHHVLNNINRGKGGTVSASALRNVLKQ